MTEHFERGGASSEHGRPHPFWPLPKGSNDHKTELAAGVLDTVLENVRWENVLMLHSWVAIYEVRNSRGFGLRWTLNLEGAANDKDNTPSTVEDKAAPEAGAENGLGEEGGTRDAPTPKLRISSVVFRGFVEPILDMDHELPDA